MSSLIERIRIWFKRSNRLRREAGSKARLAVESLEGRAMMDASFGASLHIAPFKDIPTAALHSSRSLNPVAGLPAAPASLAAARAEAADMSSSPSSVSAALAAAAAAAAVVAAAAATPPALAAAAAVSQLIARLEVDAPSGPQFGLTELIALPAIHQARPISNPVAGLPGLIAVEQSECDCSAIETRRWRH